MKTRLKIFLVFSLCIITASMMWGATITSNGTGGGVWATGTTWNGGNPPGAGDDAVISSGDIVTLGAAASITNCTVNTGGTLDATTFVLTVSAAFTLQSGATFKQGGTVSAVPGATKSIDNASTYIFNGTQSGLTGGYYTFGNLTWSSGNGTPSAGITVNGDLTVNGTGALRGVTTSGGVRIHNIVGNVNISGSAKMTGNNGGAGVGTWNIGGNVTLSGSAILQTEESASATGIGTFNINGNLIIGSGCVVRYGSNAGCTGLGAINIKGDLTNNGSIQTNLGTGYIAINFTGTGTQTVSGNAVAFTASPLSDTVAASSIVVFSGITAWGSTYSTPGEFRIKGTLTLDGTTILNGGEAFVLESGATLKIGSANGITASSASGNVQCTGTRTYNPGANYEYKGTAAQVTGDGLPSTVNNLTINNSNGVTLSGSVTVSGILTMTTGNVALNGKTLTLGTSIGSTGTLAYTAGYLTGTGTFTRYIASTATIVPPAGTFPMGVGSNNRSVEIGGTPSTGGPVAVSYYDFSTVSSISFSENAQNFVNRYDANWVVTPSGGFTETAMTLTIHGDGIPGITNVADLDLSAASVIATGVWHAPSGTTSAPVLIRDGLTQDIITTNPFYIASVGSSPLPVEMTSFTAVAQKMSALLKWSTATEVKNYGFNIERRTIASSVWAKVGFVAGNGTSNAAHNYTFADNNLSAGTYAYRIKQIDNDGSFKYSASTEVTIAGMPKELKLFGNYPNPFNPSTKVEFTVPENGNVHLSVYNVRGQEVAILFDGAAEAGNLYTANFDASHMATGIYFSVLRFGNQRITQKMLMTK